MENFKEKATKIIEGYCQGIAHLEFDVEDLPKMVQELENLALSITDVGQSFGRCIDFEIDNESGACPSQCDFCKKLPQ